MARFYKPNKKSLQNARRSASQPVGQVASEKITESVLIDRLSDDGRGIASIEGKTLFVDGALPGETATVKIVAEKPRFSEGLVHRLISTIPSRVEPRCSHYDICGGCSAQHMALLQQHSFKKRAVLQQLKHWANIEPETVVADIVGDQYSYRQRVRLGVMVISGKVVLGFRQKNSKQLVDIDQCPIMVNALSSLIKPLRIWLSTHKPAITHIELINSEEFVGVVIRHTQVIALHIRDQLQLNLKPLNARCWFQGKKQGDLENCDGAGVDPRLHYSVLVEPLNSRCLTLAYHPQDFIQANAKVNQKMITQALTLLKPELNEVFFDLFCGIGNFSLPLSLLAKKVTGIEGVATMVDRARDNAKANHCDNAHFLHMDLSQLDQASSMLTSCDGLILDPPRGGAKIICEHINKLMPKRIVYVSCDSTTFARDAQILCRNNYTLKVMGVMDMFPQTSHSEVMGLFVHPSWSAA